MPKAYKHLKNVLKLFKYFKSKVFTSVILFLQDRYSTRENEIRWKDEFDYNLYFSHGK